MQDGRYLWLPTALSAAAGALLGLYLAVFIPLSVAIARNHDPIHRGNYFEWGTSLFRILVPVGALVAGFVSWLGWCPVILRVLRWFGLFLAGLLFLYLCWVGI